MATVPHDVPEQYFEDLPPTGLEQPIHATLGPCSSLLQEFQGIDHAWKVANSVYEIRSTFSDSETTRKLIKKQSSGILYLALYLIWSISSDRIDELERLMEDTTVSEDIPTSNTDSPSQVRLQQDGEATESTRICQSTTHIANADDSMYNTRRRKLFIRKCVSLERALVEAARRLEWIKLHEADYTYARRSYEYPQMLYMTYDTCREAMEFIRKEEERSGKHALKWRVADLEAIKDWWALLQLGRRELNDFQGTKEKATKGKDECEVQIARLQERIERAKAVTF